MREHTAVKVARCVPGRGGRGNPPFLFDERESEDEVQVIRPLCLVSWNAEAKFPLVL